MMILQQGGIMEFRPFEKKIWLSSPTMHGSEQKYVKEAFDTNWVSTVGANIDALEEGICSYLGTRHAVALASGTSALHLAVKLAGVKQGDPVFCSDMTFSATVNPVSYEGGRQIFIDSEEDTWNMDPVALEKAFELYPETKVVIVADLYGTPAKLREIREICDRHHAILIEDAAEALGAAYEGRKCGTFGTYNAISFNGNKIITTSGGGMLLSDDGDAINHARKWSTQSREAAPWYQHEEIGYNYRMSNIIAGIGRGQLEYLDEHIALKKAIYERYKEGFKGLPVKMNPVMDNETANYWLSCMIIDKDAMCPQVRSERKALYIHEKGKSCPTEILETMAKYNAEGRPIWKPMHMQPIFRMNPFITRNGDERGNSNAYIASSRQPVVNEDIFERGLCLPSDIKMTAEQQDIIIQIIRSCFD